MANIKGGFKKYFFAGLITILPLWLTVAILWLVFKWISSFTSPFLSPVFYYTFGENEAGMLMRITSFVLAVLAIWFVGYLTTHLIGRRILLWVESVVLSVPLLSGIYGSARKLIQYIFASKRDFKRVVLVEFPKAGSYVAGFVTGTAEFMPAGLGRYINVFVPTAPNPTTGYLLFVEEKNTIPLDISVDEAVRMIVSGGIIIPGAKPDAGTGSGAAPVKP